MLPEEHPTPLVRVRDLEGAAVDQVGGAGRGDGGDRGLNLESRRVQESITYFRSLTEYPTHLHQFALVHFGICIHHSTLPREEAVVVHYSGHDKARFRLRVFEWLFFFWEKYIV